MARSRLSAGNLRQRITIKTDTLTDDGSGGVTKTPSTHATAWAKVEPISSREAYQQGQLQGSISHRVTLRYQAGIRPKMRVEWGSRTFQIVGVRTETEEGRIVVLDCLEERT
jgi:SPP1 family predicted phage head-tail adaptor